MQSYESFLEELKSSFESFMAEAEAGKKKKSSALKARKLSLKLRGDLQQFREASISNDKCLTEQKKAKKEAQ